MAKAKKTVPVFDAGTEYKVRVTRPINVGPFQYLPRDDLRMTGEMLTQIAKEHGADAIVAEPV
ncbi:hypothetical protein [Tianweitania sediminis]|uniref:Uncharacterized protein n=1 Tax=Tianweitania sediminis TaxID=1502156 RepID=A0A8J7R134_9HYPH|nr:hypothetical protein [Tianweitania sediminis]MBP0440693.1 hypothetical protein [Tianweitania sediminis]